METVAANSSSSLPTYSIQSSQTSISKLKEEVEAATAELLLQREFSFWSKIAKQTEKNKEMHQAVPITASKPRCPVPSFYGIRDQQDCTLVRYSQDLEDREYMLTNLSNCRVYLIGKCGALYVNTLRNCRVCTGPVTGSVLIDDVEGMRAVH